MIGVRRRVRFLLVAAAAPAAVTAAIALAAPGGLDRTFGARGIVSVKAAGFHALAIQADGRILAAGSTDGRRFGLVRLLSNGKLDRTFGGDGKVGTLFPNRQCTTVNAVAVAADGRILAAGSPGCGNGQFVLARYKRDGRLDRSFGTRGKLTTRFGGRGCVAHPSALAVQRNKRIVAAGVALCHGAGARVEFALARYKPDGRLDTSFGGDGRVTTDLTAGIDAARDIVIQSDGKIVAVGTAAQDSDPAQFALVRYQPNGSLDTSFGGDGTVMNDFSGDQACSTAEADAAALQKNGRIVVAGWGACGTTEFGLARYRSDGSLDRSFGGDGKVVTLFDKDDCSDRATDVAVQGDGRIVAVGVAGCQNPRIGLAATRYRADGRLDTSFGGDGRVTTILGTGKNCSSQLDAVALQRDRRILGAGFLGCRGKETAVVVRYLGR